MVGMNELLTQLQAQGIEVSLDTNDIESHSRDWSLFRVVPSAVVFPRTAAEIGEVVRAITSARRQDPSNKQLSVTPRAAGTDMTGGPLNTGIILDVNRHMTNIRSVTAGDFGSQSSFFGHTYPIRGRAIVQPGCFYRDLEVATHAQGLEMACYPASRDIAAVGGMAANNGAGEKSLKYGQNKDFVQSLRVILSDGNEYDISPLSYSEFTKQVQSGGFLGSLYKTLYEQIKNNWELIQSKKPKTSKNAAGYLLWDTISTSPAEFEAGNGVFDPTKFFVGAQGTTGIISEITYKLVPVESKSKLLVVYIDDLAIVPDVVDRLMKYDVEMLEMYDDNTFKIGIKFFRDFIRDKGLWGAIKYSLRFIPEVLMVLRGGVPRLIVLAEFVSNSESEILGEVYAAQKSLSDLPVRTRVILRQEGEEKFWDFRHDSFKLLTEHSKQARSTGIGTRTAPFIDDIAVNPEFLPEYLPKLITILDREQFTYTIAGHLGNGNFHIIPLMNMGIPENREKIARVSQEVYELALQYGATITAEHNDGIIRTPFLPMQFGDEMVALFQVIKNTLDPLGIFNPNKKVGGTIADIERLME